ncbi:DNA primase [Streptomyces racemochromogenes]|uniref:DNA primase n=1 Tax=Streptomyces racemochromogenes TaxID=67353 RepID=A0ABW7PEB9_9ACTN
MNNRTVMGLAVGAGYLLGRTRKARLALTVGALVAGRKLRPDIEALASVVGNRLMDRPQFKEVREQVRADLRGVGSAAVGSLVDRQLEVLAGRLHDRTETVRDRLATLTGAAGGADSPSDPVPSDPAPPPRRREAGGKAAPARKAPSGSGGGGGRRRGGARGGASGTGGGDG